MPCYKSVYCTGGGGEEGVSVLLASLVRQEVENLPRSVYHLSQAMQNAGAEPLTYNHLPDHSVLRSEGSQNSCLLPVSCNKFFSVFRICDILERIQMRIRILGAVPLTNGSGCGSVPKSTVT